MGIERVPKPQKAVPKAKKDSSLKESRTAANQQRRMRNHIRAHPDDRRAVRIYETVKKYGRATFELTSKGRKRFTRGLHHEDRIL